MPAHIQSLPIVFGPAYIRTAEVTQTVSQGVYRVRLEGTAQEDEISAHLATPVPVLLNGGDRVLVAGESPASGFIIGIVQSGQSQAIRTPDGSGAHVQGEGKDQRIAVHDVDGHVVFEYYPESRRSVLSTPHGDLQLAAPNGNIDLSAGKGVRCHGAQEVVMTAAGSVRVGVRKQDDQMEQTLRMDNDGVRIGVHEMKVTAGQGDVSIARAVYQGKQLTSRIDRAKLVYDKLEISARRLWERSEDVIRNVMYLCQMQAGRMRTLVKGAHHMHSERTTIVAKEDVRIDGRKINLG